MESAVNLAQEKCLAHSKHWRIASIIITTITVIPGTQEVFNTYVLNNWSTSQ